MGNRLMDLLFPSDEQVERYRKVAEQARAEYEREIATTPEREGTTERIRSCPNSYGYVCLGKVDWLCDLAPGFCTWDCVLYEMDECRFEGVRHHGRVANLMCLSHECQECPMLGVKCFKRREGD